jgi:hypothetical protein
MGAIELHALDLLFASLEEYTPNIRRERQKMAQKDLLFCGQM